MARIRSVKPDFFCHELLNQLEEENPTLRVMLSFEGLWNQSDKQGVFPYKPKTLKLGILPWVNYDLAVTLDLLAKNGFIKRFNYQGKEYGYIPSFPTHQRISGEEAKQAPRYPSYDMRDIEPTTTEAEEKQEGSTIDGPPCPGNGVGERSREEGKGSDAEAPQVVFSKAEALNPNKKTSEQLFQQFKTEWNHNCKPKCHIIDTLHMTRDEQNDWVAVKDRLGDSFATCKAMQNYGGILGSSEYEIDGHKGYSMLSFLVKGVEWYTDDAKPFDRCRKKQAIRQTVRVLEHAEPNPFDAKNPFGGENNG